MRIIKRLATLATIAALATVVVACHEEDSSPKGIGLRRPVEVRIAAPATRTAVGDDGLSMKWIKGDRLALWAYDDAAPVFEAVPFRFWYHTGADDRGMFVGTVDPMPAGTYTYYGASPLPEETDGTRVSYTIPAVQSGAWDSRCDIMLAATQAAGLQEEVLNEVNLHFYHKVHALKITVPEGRNRLGRPIEKLRIDFGRPVAGRMTWDMKNPDAAPEMTAATDAVTLDFATPVDEGDSFWVYIAPTDLRDAEVKFTATDGTEYSWPLATHAFEECPAGVATPVTLTIREARPQRDYRLTVDPAHLGEAVTEIDLLEMPEGYEFPSLELHNITRTITANGDGTFSMKIFADQQAGFADGIEAGLSVGSENTEGVYGKRCGLRDVSADGCTVMAPYLFFENFDGIGDHSTDNAADLSDWGLPNWSGARAHTDPGNCIVGTCHVSSHSGITNSRSKGRVDTSRLPIRNGKTVDVKVSFDMGYNTRSGTGGGNAVATCTFGRTDTADAQTTIDADADFTQTVFTETQVAKLSDTRNLPDKLTDQTVAGCNASSRLSWQIFTYKSSGWSAVTNVSYDCYIDNISVTIAH